MYTPAPPDRARAPGRRGRRIRAPPRSPSRAIPRVYNDWKLGYGQAQDGVLVMVAVGDRFSCIELGDDVPAQQDARMQAIMDERRVPRFRDGDYSEGVMEGVQAIAESFHERGYATAPQLIRRPRTAPPAPPRAATTG